MATGAPWVVLFRIAEGGCRKRLGGKKPSDCIILPQHNHRGTQPALVKSALLLWPGLAVGLPAVAPQTAA
jgi:hypothetical protein